MDKLLRQCQQRLMAGGGRREASAMRAPKRDTGSMIAGSNACAEKAALRR